MQNEQIEEMLYCPDINGTMHPMSKKTKRGRPPKDQTRGDYLEVRLDEKEKQAFKDAAELSGLAMSAWTRERLRAAAKKELEAAGKKVPFLVD